MSKKANPALVGAFVVGVCVLATAGVILFGSGRFTGSRREFVLYFDRSVKGLNVGAPVRFRGVKIGQVIQVSVILELETLASRVPVVVEIDPNRLVGGMDESRWSQWESSGQRKARMEVLAQHGLRAVLGLESVLTGQLSVELDFYPGSPIKYRDVADGLVEIPTKPSELEVLTRTLEDVPIKEVVDKLRSSLNAVEKFVNSPELLEMAQTGARAIAEARELIGRSRETIETLRGSLDSTLAESRELMKDVRQRLNPLAESAQVTLDGLRESIKHVDALAEDLRSSAGPRSEVQQELLRTLKEASDAARSVRVLAETLERQPQALLTGKPDLGGK